MCPVGQLNSYRIFVALQAMWQSGSGRDGKLDVESDRRAVGDRRITDQTPIY